MGGLAFAAAVEAAAADEPGHGPFDGPTASAESLRGLGALVGDAVPDASLRQLLSQVAVVVVLVGVELAGPATTRPRQVRIGGTPFTSGTGAWLSWTLAPEIPTDRGRPVRSVIRWIFEPCSPLPT